MARTYVTTVNARVNRELKRRDVGSEEDQVRRLIGLQDGVERHSLSLWALPNEFSFEEVDLRKYPEEYIQCAGSAAGNLTAEMRRLANGVPVQYVIGRPKPMANDADREVIISWAQFKAVVHQNEALTMEEVIELFIAYYRTGDIPASWSRRLLHLT
jgi:hypothetical protein